MYGEVRKDNYDDNDDNDSNAVIRNRYKLLNGYYILCTMLSKSNIYR